MERERRFPASRLRHAPLGPLRDTLVVIVTAEIDDHIRIVSMRKADRHEQGIYRENIG